MKKVLKQLRKASGVSAVEYTLVLGLVAVVVMLWLGMLGERTSDAIGNTAVALEPVDTEQPVHLTDIDLRVRTWWGGRVTGIVRVLDRDDRAVRRATVHASWSVNGTVAEDDSGRTNWRGRTRLTYTSDELESDDVVRLAVTSVASGGVVYDSGSNVQKEAEVTVP